MPCVRRKLNTRDRHQGLPCPVVKPKRFNTAAMVLSSQTLANSPTSSISGGGAAPAMHSWRVARHSQLGMHSSCPMDLQTMFGGILVTGHHDLLDHGSQYSFLQLARRLGRLPQSLQVLAHLQELLFLLGRDRLRRLALRTPAPDSPVPTLSPRPDSTALPIRRRPTGSPVPPHQTAAALVAPRNAPSPTPVPPLGVSRDPANRACSLASMAASIPAGSIAASISATTAASVRKLPTDKQALDPRWARSLRQL